MGTEGSNFTDALRHLDDGVRKHAQRDKLRGVGLAVFLDRGGHAPGERCPSEPAESVDHHEYWCQYPEGECSC